MRTLTLNQETTKNLLEELLKRSPSSYTAYEDTVAEIVKRYARVATQRCFPTRRNSITPK